MILFKKTNALHEYLKRKKKDQHKIGFVPTMGALHEGHLSLIKKSVQSNECTVCSIFINPTQFNNAADFKKYPVTLETDISLLEHANTDILFLPDAEEIYPDGTSALLRYPLGKIENILEGFYRPGHFQGVCQVMHRLLDIVHPDNLYMGQKDYQQCMVLKKLLEIIQSDAVLHTCATMREPDGLALSSRNLRLNEEERKEAVAISQVLLYIKKDLQPGPLEMLIEEGKNILSLHHFKTDYVAIANAATLEQVSNWDGNTPLIALIAAYMNEVRLIDNMELEASGQKPLSSSIYIESLAKTL